MGNELLRLIDAIYREKGIDREILFQALESALTTAARKRLGVGEDFEIVVDRENGNIESGNDEYEVSPAVLGRIAAQTAKQIFHQKVREAEQETIFEHYSEIRGEMVTGRVSKFEGDAIIVDLSNRVEGIIPRDQRVRGEMYKPGDSIRCLIYDVKKVGHRVRIILSRSNPDIVERLFEIEVPEIDDGIIHINRVVREPGYRTKIAVSSTDAKIDCVGACVGIRGSRIKSIIDELNGEKIDIIRWSDSLEVLVMNALKPAQIDLDDIYPDEEEHRVIVIVDEDQQSLAIGKRGQNVRLASHLCTWEIDIKTRADLEEMRGEQDEEVKDEELPAEPPIEAPPEPQAPAAEAAEAMSVEDESEGTIEPGAPEHRPDGNAGVADSHENGDPATSGASATPPPPAVENSEGAGLVLPGPEPEPEPEPARPPQTEEPMPNPGGNPAP